MARIRSVHPGLATDARFVLLSDAAQIFFVLLLTAADDAGVFRWEPLELRMQLRPASTAPVEPLLEELAAGNFLRRFEAGGNAYGAVRNFRRYQSPKSPTQRHPLPANLFSYVGVKPDTAPVGKGAMSPTERARRYRARHGTVTKSAVTAVTQSVTGTTGASQNGENEEEQNQIDGGRFPQLCGSATETLPQLFPTDRDRERDKEKKRESLVERTSPLPREAAPDTPTRLSLKIFKDEGEAEPRPSHDEIPEGWLAEAAAARDEAGLEGVNLPLEWAKFATRADGPVELRRWIEWALRAWVNRNPKHKANGATPAETVAETPWAARMRQWRHNGWWLPSFGPRPGEPGCFVPPQYLAEAAESETCPECHG